MNNHKPESPPELGAMAEDSPSIQVLADQAVPAHKSSWWELLGPGFITGASDDDPSGIGTYAAAGAAFGYATLWMAWVSYPLMAGVQVICARIAQVSGRGLAGVLAKHYPRPVVLFSIALLLVANTINAGADIGAIAAAVNLLVPAAPILWLIVPVTALILGFQIYGSYAFIERTFKWLALALLAYIASAFLAHPDWSAVAHATVMPSIHWDGKFIATVVAILGTTISPYLFFWQASEEIELEKAHGLRSVHQREGATDVELKERAIDVNFGMAFSNIVMFFIILATAATLFKSGHTTINSATEAAEALRPIAGVWATQLFAIGLIGTGLLAVPILTCSSAFAIAEAFAWRAGLDQKPHQAKRFYAVIVASMIIGMAINYVGINPMSALFWTAVLNGVLAPPLLVVIMLVSNNKDVMGERVNGPVLNTLGWGATVSMTAAAVALFLTWGK
jgi:NRAMP (natural resistance-associated macrophage protein)-like metal ion transporter